MACEHQTAAYSFLHSDFASYHFVGWSTPDHCFSCKVLSASRTLQLAISCIFDDSLVKTLHQRLRCHLSDTYTKRHDSWCRRSLRSSPEPSCAVWPSPRRDRYCAAFWLARSLGEPPVSVLYSVCYCNMGVCAAHGSPEWRGTSCLLLPSRIVATTCRRKFCCCCSGTLSSRLQLKVWRAIA